MMNRLLLILVATAAFVAGLGTSAQCGVVVIHPSQDNSIYSESDNSNALGGLFAGVTGGPNAGNLRRALLQFDILDSGIPAGSVITSVTLGLTQTKIGPGSSATFELHPLWAAWGQGTSIGTGGGGSPTPGDATWNYRLYNTSHWTLPGGDFGSTSGTTTIGTTNTLYTFASQPGLVADVQNWLNAPTSNFGWILRAADESPGLATAREFGSLESGNPNWPTLTVNFAPPAIWLSATSGAWSVGTNWNTGTAPNGAGQTAVLNKTTTAVRTVTLDSPETVGTLQFGNSGGDPSAGYMISGTNALTLDNGTKASMISVSEGTHAISAAITVNGNLDISPATGSTLTISGNIRPSTSGLSLTLMNSGVLILSGSNDYGGGTTVNAGTLRMADPHAVADGTSLTVGAGAASIFAQATTGAEGASSSVTVPEPASFVLLAAGAVELLGVAWRERNRKARPVGRAAYWRELIRVIINATSLGKRNNR